MKTIQNISKRALLVILDGFGINTEDHKNAIKAAAKPNLDFLFSHFPYTTIEAGGEAVGLPKGVAGNSEVGHMNLGAGRPVRQDLVRINEAIRTKTLEAMPELQNLISKAKAGNKKVHLMGLLSDGGVHSSIDHLEALVEILSSHGLKLWLHAFADGRDTEPSCAAKYIERIDKNSKISFASIQGRSIGMDRDRRWEKIKRAYDTFLGSGECTSLSPINFLHQEYNAGRSDEFLNPVLFDKDGAITKDDCVFFFNFRPDRAIQLSLVFNDKTFNEFERPFLANHFLCMVPYIPDEVELPILFDKEQLQGVMADHLESLGLNQFHIAETEKYAHVTYFFNGGNKKEHKGESFVLVPSPKEVETYNQKPEMSAPEVTKKLVAAIEDKTQSFMLVNYANCDMVGHTGDFKAAIKAVEAVDQCIGELIKACKDNDVTMLLTADHGNSDQMAYEDGTPHTSHTGAPVPFSLYSPKLEGAKIEISPGPHALKDVCPTALYVMGLEMPKSFSGKPIFK
tara:strand:+ start:8539 stop:10071 length:1533 start_codon:yes stop_codon:yes gene_type:complete